MNFRRTFAVVVMVITGFASCAMLPRHGNNYFTESEKEVFKASAAGLGLYTGYDSDLSLNYIFKREQRASVPDQAAFNKSFEEFDNDMLVAYFLKLYSIQVSVEYLELYYKNNKKWPMYNYLNKQIIPGVKTYMESLNSYLAGRDAGLYASLETQKAEVYQRTILAYQEKFNIVDEY